MDAFAGWQPSLVISHLSEELLSLGAKACPLSIEMKLSALAVAFGDLTKRIQGLLIQAFDDLVLEIDNLTPVSSKRRMGHS